MARPLTITANGNAQVDTGQNKFGGASAQFDGTGDYLRITRDSSLSLGSGDFTIEFWYRLNGSTANMYITADQDDGALGWAIYHGSSLLRFYASANGTTWGITSARTIHDPAINTWYHVAIVRSGNNWKAFVDGTEIGGFAFTSSSAIHDSGNDITIGGLYEGSTAWMNGWVDEFRISSVARYTSNFTPSTTPFVNDENTLLLIHTDGTDASTNFFDDNGGRAIATPYAEGTNYKISTADSKFGGSSLVGAATTSTNIKSSIDMSGVTNYTFECWVKFTSTADNAPHLIHWAGSNSRRIYATLTGAEANRLYYADGSFYYWSYTWSTNTWYHIAVTKSSTGAVNAFINGTKLSSEKSTSGTHFVDGYTSFIIGKYAGGTTGQIVGYLDEVRISKTVRYTNNFTAPTAAFGNDSDTLALYHFDGTNNSTDFADDNSAVGVTHEGAANLSASATISTTGNRIKQFSLSAASLFTPTLVGVASKNGSIDIAGIANISVSGDRIRSGNSSISATASTSVNGGKNVDCDATINSVASQTAVNDRIRSFAFISNSLFTPTLVAVANRNGSTDLVSNSSVSILADRIRIDSATLNVSGNLTADALRIQSGDSSLSSSFSQTTNGIKVIVGESLLNSAMTSSVAGDRIRFGDSTQNSTGSLSAAGVLVIEGSATLNSAGNLVANNERIRSGDIATFSLFTPNITAIASKNGSTDLLANSSLSVDYNRVRIVNVALATSVNLSLQGDRIRFGVNENTSTANLTTTALRIKQLTGSGAVSANLTVDGTRIRFGQPELDIRYIDSGYVDPDYYEDESAFVGSLTADISVKYNLIASGAGAFSVNAIPNSIASGAGNISVVSNTSALGGFLLTGSSSINASAQTTANGIEYQLRPNPYNRPIDITHNGTYSTTAYDGSYSLRLNSQGGNANTELTNAFAFGANEDFVIEIPIRFTNTGLIASPVRTVTYGAGVEPSWEIQLQSGSAGLNRINFRFWDGSQFRSVNETRSTGFVYPGLTWIPIKIKRTSGVISITTDIDNATRTTYNFSGAFKTPAETNSNFLNLTNSMSGSNNYIFYDKIRIARGTTTVGNRWDQETVVWYDFEQTATDNRTQDFTGSATVNSVGSISANGGKLVSGSATLNSTTTASTNGGYKFEGEGSFNATGSVGVDYTRIRSAETTQNAIFSQTVVFDRIRRVNSPLSCGFEKITTAQKITDTDSQLILSSQINAIPLRIQQISISANAFNSSLFAVNKIGNTLVSIGIVSQLSAAGTMLIEGSSGLTSMVNSAVIGDRIRFADTDLSYQSIIDITGVKTANGVVSILSNSALQTEVLRTRDVHITLNTTANISVINSRIRDSAVNLDSTAFCESDVNKTRSGSATLNASTGISVVNTRAKLFAANLAGITTTTTEPVKTADSGSTITSVFACQIAGIRIRFSSINVSALYATLTSAAKTGVTPVDCNSEFLLTVDGTSNIVGEFNKTAEFSLTSTGKITTNRSFDLVVETDIEAIAIKQVFSEVDVNTLSTMVVNGKIIAIDVIVYTIPAETRLYTMPSDVKVYTINRETRIYKIEEIENAY